MSENPKDKAAPAGWRIADEGNLRSWLNEQISRFLRTGSHDSDLMAAVAALPLYTAERDEFESYPITKPGRIMEPPGGWSRIRIGETWVLCRSGQVGLQCFRADVVDREVVKARSERFRAERAERTFSADDCGLWAVFSWIAFRDPGCVCAFDDESSFRLFKRYDAHARYAPVMVEHPEREFMSALKRGRVTAWKDGAPLPKEHWLGKGLEAVAAENPRFLWLDVRKLWRQSAADDLLERYLDERKRPAQQAREKVRRPVANRARPRRRQDVVRGLRGLEERIHTVVRAAVAPRRLSGAELQQTIKKALRAAIEDGLAKGEKLNGKNQVLEAMKYLRAWAVRAPKLKDQVEHISDRDFGGLEFRNPEGVTLRRHGTKS